MPLHNHDLHFFRRNVDCETKSDDEVEESSPAPFASTTETSSEEEENGSKKSGDKKEPKTLEEVLAAIKEAGKAQSKNLLGTIHKCLLCISTSFWVLGELKSWSTYFFQLFSSFFVHFKPFLVISRLKMNKKK